MSRTLHQEEKDLPLARVVYFEGRPLRLLMDEPGAPWFVARDVTEILGLNRTAARHVAPSDKREIRVVTAAGVQPHKTMNTNGLLLLAYHGPYRSSELTRPRDRFRKWLSQSLLPGLAHTMPPVEVAPATEATTSEMMIYGFDTAEIRVIERDGEPWFVATDVAAALGFSNPSKAVKDHCKAPRRMTLTNRYGQKGGARFHTIIPERDLYRMILRSRLPAAERFEEWVVGEILPALRRRGYYRVMAGDGLSDRVPDFRDAGAAELAWLAAQERIRTVEREIEEMRPSADAFRRLQASPKSVSLYGAAKILKINPRAELIPWLESLGWIYRDEDGGIQPMQYRAYNGDIEAGLTEGGAAKPYLTAKGLARLALMLGRSPCIPVSLPSETQEEVLFS